MGKRIDLTGQRFGRLVVESYAGRNKRRDGLWVCKCDCGRWTTTKQSSLKSGKTRSCGCLQKDTAREQHLKYGKKHSRLYSIWHGMIGRTENENHANFKYYGSRGIRICDEWRCDFQKFYNWAINSGYKEGLTIDRVDVNGNYSPENCRWATRKEQANGTRRNAKILYKGETLTLQQWAERFHINKGTLWNRLNALGWSVEDAFETPVGQRRKK